MKFTKLCDQKKYKLSISTKMAKKSMSPWTVYEAESFNMKEIIWMELTWTKLARNTN